MRVDTVWDNSDYEFITFETKNTHAGSLCRNPKMWLIKLLYLGLKLITNMKHALQNTLNYV